MNDNTILRIKVPAHLYESVKEQLTLNEAKGKAHYGAGMEVVKEKKSAPVKDGMKKVEEKKDGEIKKEGTDSKKPRSLDELMKAKDMLEKKIEEMKAKHSVEETKHKELNEASLELDWASGINSLKAKCKKHGLTCKVVKEKGPAGFNPLVKIMGSKDNIMSFLKDGYADDDQLEDYAADIKGK